MFFNLTHKINPEKELKALSEQLQSALGARLKSVVSFGSVVQGDFDPKHSNLNVLIVSDLSFVALQAMGPAVQRWLAKGLTPPVLVAPDDLDDFARDFPVEFLDMVQHHRVLWGEDVLAGLDVNKKHLESQIEHDLALIQLRLRQAILASDGNHDRLRTALKTSVSSVLVLLYSTWRLLESQGVPLDKIQAAEKLAQRWGFDLTPLKEVEALRRQRESQPITDLTSKYLVLIEALLTELRKN